MSKVSLVIFDCDGVLVDSERIAVRVDIELFRQLGWHLSETEVIERFVSLMTYVLVPLSGTFYMAAWLPPAYRDSVLYLPLLHPVEMVRAGFFGDSVHTYYSAPYAAAWAAGLTLIGLLLMRFVRRRIEVE